MKHLKSFERVGQQVLVLISQFGEVSLSSSGLLKSLYSVSHNVAVVGLKYSLRRYLQSSKITDFSLYYAHSTYSTCVVSNPSEYYALRIFLYGHSIVPSCHCLNVASYCEHKISFCVRSIKLSCYCLISAFYYVHSNTTTAVTILCYGHKIFFYGRRRICLVLLLSDVMYLSGKIQI